jgi:membrane-associated protein
VGNIIGAVLWSVVLCLAGFFLGKISFVAHNIELIAVAIVIISVLPIVIGALRNRAALRRRRKGSPVASAAPDATPLAGE